MDIAFFGSHPLGEECLNILSKSEEVNVCVVVTYPEDEDHWWSGSVHSLAKDLGYEVLTIEEERDILNYKFDYLLSIYYPNILGEKLLQHSEKGAINLHQAELPRYQGSNVFSHSIINARKDNYWKHGTTLHFMEEEVDTGDVIDRGFIEITENDTARSLYEKTRERSIQLFKETLPKIVSGEIHDMRTPQSEFEGPRYFYYKSSLDGEKRIPLERLINSKNELEIYDKIRALDFPPFKPAYTEINGKEIYLTKSSYEDFKGSFVGKSTLFD